MKKVITAEQLRAYRGRSEICLDEDTILTPSAQDAAREMGLTVRIGNCDATQERATGPLMPAPLAPLAAQGGDAVVIAAFGPDRPGILAAISGCIAEQGGNITDLSQTILQGYFSLVLSVACPASTSFGAFKARIKQVGEGIGLEVTVQKQTIFQAMHRI